MKKTRFMGMSLCRLIALILCLAAAIPQVGATARVYIRYQGADASSSYLYVWGTSNAMGGWPGKQISTMSSTGINGKTYYYVDINQATINLILNNSNGQTADITVSNPGTYYITYYGGNSYSGPTSYAEGSMFVVGGNSSIFPNQWGVGDATVMQSSNGTNFTWTSSQVHLDMNTDYEYKVRDYGGNNWYPNGDNAKFNVSQPGTYTVTVTYNSDTHAVNATPNLIAADPTYTYNIFVRYTGSQNPSNVYMHAWDSNGDKTSWPGKAFSTMNTTAINGYTYYTISYTGYASTMELLFNENGNPQTTDRTLQPGDNYFTYNGGTSAIGPSSTPDDAVIDYFVVGDDSSIFPLGWNTGTANQMAEDNGTYIWTANNVHLVIGTDYEYKVTGSDGTWYPDGPDNATFNVNKNGTYHVEFTLDGTNVNAVPTLVTEDQIYTYDIYVRYKGNENVDNVFAFTFDAYGVQALDSWGGTSLASMTPTPINGYTYYHTTITSYDTQAKVIFNENESSNTQTEDLTMQPGDNYFTYSGGNTVSGPNPAADPAMNYYAESDFAGWTIEGTQMTANGDGSYSKTYTGVALDSKNEYGYRVYASNGADENYWIGDGNNTFTPTISGTYTVTITLNSNGTMSHSLTLTQPGTMYITGDGVLGDFSSDAGIAMTDAGNGVYTYTTTLNDKATTRFIFSDGQAGWDAFNSSYRIAPVGGDDEQYTVNSGYTVTQKSHGDHGAYSVTAGAGTLTFYLDVINMQYKVEGTVPPTLYYVVGNDANLFGAVWTQNSNGQMTYDDQTGTYTWSISDVRLTAGGDYEFKVSGDDGSWYPGEGYDNISINVSQNGTYNLTVTFDGQNAYYTLTPVSIDVIYIQGSSGLGLGWSFAPTTEMTYDASTGYFTYTTVVENEGTYNFVFGNGQGTDWDDYNSNYRIGPSGSTDQSIMPNDEWNNTQMAAGSTKAYSITVNPCTVTFTFDPLNMRFKVDGESLTHRYTFYVLPSDGTTVPYIYLWGLGTDEAYSNTYPGTRLTETEQLADGNTWHKLTVDLTAPFIHALVNAGGDIADDTKTQDITHIDPGTYYIYWTMPREPGEPYNDYTLTTVPPTDAGSPFYIHGTYYLDGEQYHYGSDSGTRMKYDANTHTYYLNNVYLASDNTFCFSTALGEDWQHVGTRYGNGGPDYHVGEGTTNYLPVDENRINKNMPLSLWSEIYGEFKMFVPGIYNVLANPEQHWVRLIKTDHTTLSPMNVYLEQTPNVVMSKDGNNFIQDPGTIYSTDIFGDGNWPLAAYNGTRGDWNPHDNGNAYHVTYIGDTITADGKKWWHWQVKASIAEVFFTRLDKTPLQSDTIRRKAGMLWVTWDEVDGKSTLTDHSREYFDAAANELPTNAVVMEGHYYVYFINTVGWEDVYCYAWDNNVVTDDQGNPMYDDDGQLIIDNTFYDGYSRLMNKWPGQICELIGIDPVTGYEVWRYDFGTIIGTDIPNGGILFNDGFEYGESEGKEQTGDFEYVNGAVYDYLGMVDGAFTLNNIIRKGTPEVRYTISNDLLGVYYDADAVTRITYLDEYEQEQHEDIRGALYAKDLNLYGEKSIMPDDSYTDYVYDICASDHTPGRSQIMIKKTTYDQSNWIKLVVSPNYDDRHAVVPKDERPDLSQFVNHIIPGGSLDIFMTDTINPEAHVLSIKMGDDMKYEPNVYISSHFNDTVVFNFTHKNWLGANAEYKPNYSCQPKITWNYDDEGAVTGGVAERHPNYDNPIYMYYVAPKPQELAYITWVVYDNYNQDEIWPGYTHGEYNAVTGEGRGNIYPQDPGRFYAPKNWNRTIYLDAAAYPNLSQITEGSELEKALGAWSPEYGPYSNGYMQYGGIKINWSLFDEEASGAPWWHLIKPGQAYKILAIVRYARGSGQDNSADNFYYGPSNGFVDDNLDDGDDSAPGSVHNAPRRAVDPSSGYANMYFTDYDYLNESKFIIFPIMASGDESNGNDLGNVTSVKEVKTATSRDVVAVRYYNLMGVESNKPFDGINIVVTTYSDGSRTSRKILR